MTYPLEAVQLQIEPASHTINSTWGKSCPGEIFGRFLFGSGLTAPLRNDQRILAALPFARNERVDWASVVPFEQFRAQAGACELFIGSRGLVRGSEADE